MAKPISIEGKRFGYLTVLKRAENTKRGNTQWLCKCDCGNEKICSGYDLTHGRTVSCGCSIQKKDKPSPKRISLIGNKYGKLTVISLNEELTKNGRLVWNCMCDCGNTFTASGANLKSGKATHCGCSKPKRSNNFKDITGKRYGELTVEKFVGVEKNKALWLCTCDCGNKVIRPSNYFYSASGRNKRCGDRTKHKKNSKYASLPGSKRLHSEWGSMKYRCSKNYHNHKNYYDKNIHVCDEWQEYANFVEWALDNGYSDDLTIDRIDNSKGYSPDNCRWVTMKVQQNNKTSNHFITIHGEAKTISQWSDYSGIPPKTIRARILRGWENERLLEPLHKNQYQ